MLKRWFCAGLMTLVLASPALAHNEDLHPLDQAFQQCIDLDGSTAGMHACNDRFRQYWDQELNRYYQLLGGDRNRSLREAQKAWIRFRDAEYQRLTAFYGQVLELSGGGTLWPLLANSARTDLIRQRVLTLQSDYQMICEMQSHCEDTPAWGWHR
ncbi:MAG: DUF1311 domain-containing protein [Candidatus Sericytochromatia bacterium]|nr:DUF1311 domain-containing protein [Candidatus Sericytochromatia bacterium]